jgi:hypothetical protein
VDTSCGRWRCRDGNQPWLTLQEAADLVVPVPQADICRALVDGRIKFRALIDVADIGYGGRWVGHDISTGTSFIGVRVPYDLRSEGLDWATSRPLERWEVGVDASNSEETWRLRYPPDDYRPRTIARLELLRSDVEEVFGIAEQPAPEPDSQQEQPAQPSGPSPGRPPEEANRVRDRMLDALRSGATSAKVLRKTKADALAFDYGTSPYVARKARKAALQLFEQ